MKIFNQMLALAGVATLLNFSVSSLPAQEQQQPQDQQQRRQRGGGGPGGGGNFDPEQMRQRQMERYREQLEVKDDAEWKLISERIENVSKARRELGTMGFGGFGRGGGGPGGAGGGGRRGGFGGEPLPEQEALQKAIEAKASNDELKTKLAKLREARKGKEAALEKAQDELRKVLSVRQEAAAVLAGLLK